MGNNSSAPETRPGGDLNIMSHSQEEDQVQDPAQASVTLRTPPSSTIVDPDREAPEWKKSVEREGQGRKSIPPVEDHRKSSAASIPSPSLSFSSPMDLDALETPALPLPLIVRTTNIKPTTTSPRPKTPPSTNTTFSRKRARSSLGHEKGSGPGASELPSESMEASTFTSASTSSTNRENQGGTVSASVRAASSGGVGVGVVGREVVESESTARMSKVAKTTQRDRPTSMFATNRPDDGRGPGQGSKESTASNGGSISLQRMAPAPAPASAPIPSSSTSATISIRSQSISRNGQKSVVSVVQKRGPSPLNSENSEKEEGEISDEEEEVLASPAADVRGRTLFSRIEIDPKEHGKPQLQSQPSFIRQRYQEQGVQQPSSTVSFPSPSSSSSISQIQPIASSSSSTISHTQTPLLARISVDKGKARAEEFGDRQRRNSDIDTTTRRKNSRGTNVTIGTGNRQSFISERSIRGVEASGSVDRDRGRERQWERDEERDNGEKMAGPSGSGSDNLSRGFAQYAIGGKETRGSKIEEEPNDRIKIQSREEKERIMIRSLGVRVGDSPLSFSSPHQAQQQSPRAISPGNRGSGNQVDISSSSMATARLFSSPPTQSQSAMITPQSQPAQAAFFRQTVPISYAARPRESSPTITPKAEGIAPLPQFNPVPRFPTRSLGHQTSLHHNPSGSSSNPPGPFDRFRSPPFSGSDVATAEATSSAIHQPDLGVQTDDDDTSMASTRVIVKEEDRDDESVAKEPTRLTMRERRMLVQEQQRKEEMLRAMATQDEPLDRQGCKELVRLVLQLADFGVSHASLLECGVPAEYYARILQSRMNQLRRVKESAAAREMQPGSELIEEVHFVPPDVTSAQPTTSTVLDEAVPMDLDDDDDAPTGPHAASITYATDQVQPASSAVTAEALAESERYMDPSAATSPFVDLAALPSLVPRLSFSQQFPQPVRLEELPGAQMEAASDNSAVIDGEAAAIAVVGLSGQDAPAHLISPMSDIQQSEAEEFNPEPQAAPPKNALSELRARLLADKLRKMKAQKAAPASMERIPSEEGELLESPLMESPQVVLSPEHESHREPDFAPTLNAQAPSWIPLFNYYHRVLADPSISTSAAAEDPIDVDADDQADVPLEAPLTISTLPLEVPRPVTRASKRMTAADFADAPPSSIPSASLFRTKRKGPLAPNPPRRLVIELNDDSDESSDEETARDDTPQADQENIQSRLDHDADLRLQLERKMRDLAESKAKLAAFQARKARLRAGLKENGGSTPLGDASPMEAASPSPILGHSVPTSAELATTASSLVIGTSPEAAMDLLESIANDLDKEDKARRMRDEQIAENFNQLESVPDLNNDIIMSEPTFDIPQEGVTLTALDQDDVATASQVTDKPNHLRPIPTFNNDTISQEPTFDIPQEGSPSTGVDGDNGADAGAADPSLQESRRPTRKGSRHRRAPKPEEAAQMIAKGVTSPAVADASQNQPTETGQDEFLRQALKDGAGDDHSREVSPSLPQNAPSSLLLNVIPPSKPIPNAVIKTKQKQPDAGPSTTTLPTNYPATVDQRQLLGITYARLMQPQAGNPHDSQDDPADATRPMGSALCGYELSDGEFCNDKNCFDIHLGRDVEATDGDLIDFLDLHLAPTRMAYQQMRTELPTGVAYRIMDIAKPARGAATESWSQMDIPSRLEQARLRKEAVQVWVDKLKMILEAGNDDDDNEAAPKPQPKKKKAKKRKISAAQ